MRKSEICAAPSGVACGSAAAAARLVASSCAGDPLEPLRPCVEAAADDPGVLVLRGARLKSNLGASFSGGTCSGAAGVLTAAGAFTACRAASESTVRRTAPVRVSGSSSAATSEAASCGVGGAVGSVAGGAAAACWPCWASAGAVSAAGAVPAVAPALRPLLAVSCCMGRDWEASFCSFCSPFTTCSPGPSTEGAEGTIAGVKLCAGATQATASGSAGTWPLHRKRNVHRRTPLQG